MVRIRAQDLEGFADLHVARDILPELMRRLIRATSDRVEDVYFPGGESTFRPGVDGIVRASGVPPFVPDGVSVWEVGTDNDSRSKVRRDFDKRSRPTDRDIYNDTHRANITFVAVSLRRINATRKQDRDELETELKNKGVWRDVKVIDAEHLEIWLDETPSVRAWLAMKMEKAVPDIRDLGTFLQSYCRGTRYAMSPDLLLANRETAVEKIRESGLNRELTRVRADSPREAAAFVAAAIQTADSEDVLRNALLAKAVVIEDPASKAYLADSKNKLYVVTFGSANTVAGELSNAGHTVMACYGTSHAKGAGHTPLIVLPRASRHQFAEVLKASGVPDDDARRTTIECHSSVSIYRRQNDPAHAESPSWARPAELRKLIGPILAGAFAHASPEDQAIVQALAGEADYDAVERNVLDMLRVDDAPVLREGDLTALSAPAYIWQLSIEHQVINLAALTRFRDAVLRVLSEPDPALELPPEKQIYADIYGKKLQYSSTLRAGIAEILRLIAINDQSLRYIGGFSAQHFVNEILKAIPGLATDYRMLASLDSLLPVLAEAAPSPFLWALEELTAADSAVLSPIFEGSDDTMFGRPHYLGILRGLEVLAWDPDQLASVSTQLAKLAAIDPGGNLSNRPINSLIQIFLPWFPHTNATPDHRHSVLRMICEAVPSIAWRLVSGLLPVDRGISFGTAKPEWRDAGASERPKLTYGSVARDYEFMIDLAVLHAGVDAARWIDILRSVVEGGLQEKFEELLQTIEARQGEFREADTDKALWEKLSALADHHYGFADAAWAMPPAQVLRLEAVAALFEPSNPLELYRPKFNSYLLERAERLESVDDRDARTQRERDHAFGEIAAQGIDVLINFAESLELPQLLVPSIARREDPFLSRDIVLGSYDRKASVQWMAALVAANAVTRFGIEWGIDTLKQVAADGANATQIAALAVPWNDTRELLDFVRTQPEEFRVAYWAGRDIYVRSDDDALVAEFVMELIEYGRSYQLIEFLGAHRSKTTSEMLLTVLERGFDEITQDLEKVRRIDRYWLSEVFKDLVERDDVDRDRLMSLEYRWLPLLNAYGEPHQLALHRYLGQSPEFFIEVLSHLYKANSEITSEEANDAATSDEGDATDTNQGTEQDSEASYRRSRADSAYKLLESWQTLPWKTANDKLDATAMIEWTQRCLALARQADRAEVGAREIGKLLAYAPDDSEDGLWPTVEVRQLLEAVSNDDLEDGMVNELFNKRGVHWRPPEGGGDPERELATVASHAAKALAERWPRSAKMLRKNAEQWLRHAEWDDRRTAEQKIRI